MAGILVIDDEPRMVDVLCRALARDGHSAEGATDGTEGLERALADDYELIVLDLSMPGLHGSTVLKRTVAERPNQSVLVLSANSDVETKVRCFEQGAADYLTKPFALAELLARVRTRVENPPNQNGRGNGNGTGNKLEAGGITLDLQSRVVDAGTGPTEMSSREFLLLKYLMTRAGEVCSRQDILSEVWGCSFDPGTNVVDVYIRRLRSKVGPDVIETVRNVGYTLPE